MSATSAHLKTILAPHDRDEFSRVLGQRVCFDHPLADYTSWKIGGPADAFATIHSEHELAETLRYCERRSIPWFVLGSGSNLLVGDGGIRGIVFRLAGEFSNIDVLTEDDRVIVRAGASAGMAAMTARAATAGAYSISSLAGIPGSVGGSLRMNAGTDREVGDFVRSVRIQSPRRAEPHAVDVRYFYRHTSLARDAVVVSVEFSFERANANDVRQEMQARLIRRKNTQPISMPNAGSCFRNPEGEKAARLIEAVGAKGWREGDAQISELHANFINNCGQASARDVATLLARTRRAVYERFGVKLQPEVHLVGVFIDA